MSTAVLIELFGDKLLGKNGEDDLDKLLKPEDDTVIGVYFSAHWCPPCRGFTPKLVQFYETCKGNGKKFEIIFVSSDRNEDAFTSYYEEMPWLALPFGHDKKEGLSAKYKVSGIPTLILLNSSGAEISKDGRGAVLGDPDKFPWPPRPTQQTCQ